MLVVRRGTFAAVANAVIIIMGCYDKRYRHSQEKILVLLGKLLQHKKDKAN
jgi:hypothetical protein